MALKPSYVAVLLLLLVKPLPAQESAAEPQALPPKAPAQLSVERAWLVVGSALVAGAFLAGSGLSAECAGETSCRRLASLSLWGGIGVASAGTIFGLTLIQQDRDTAVRNQVGLTVAGGF
jgi:hypothetical protein